MKSQECLRKDSHFIKEPFLNLLPDSELLCDMAILTWKKLSFFYLPVSTEQGHIRPRFLHRAATANGRVRSNRSQAGCASFGGVRDEFGNKSVVSQSFCGAAEAIRGG